MTVRPDWVTLEQAAELAGRDKRTIQRWIKQGLLTPWRPVRRVLVRAEAVLVVEAKMDALSEKPHFGRHADAD